MFPTQPRVSAALVGFPGSYRASAMKHAHVNVPTPNAPALADVRIGESGFRTWRPPA